MLTIIVLSGILCFSPEKDPVEILPDRQRSNDLAAKVRKIIHKRLIFLHKNIFLAPQSYSILGHS